MMEAEICGGKCAGKEVLENHQPETCQDDELKAIEWQCYRRECEHLKRLK